MGPVIHERSFKKVKSYVGTKLEGAKIITGGKCDDSVGYFIEPTVIQADDPSYKSLHEEIFGPVLTVYVYKASEYSEIVSCHINPSFKK